jgi:hypothetical protein
MTIEIFSKAAKTKSAPKIAFPAQMQLKDHLREMSRDANGHRIYEFMGTDSFGAEWQQRQRFEVNAGRDEEPILYTPLYDVVSDASLPKNVDVNTMGPGGVVFEEVFEGGEVKFSSISSGEYTALLNHLHISPILTYTYAAANQTAAVTSGATTTEDWLLTIEAGIAASKSDTSNPRRGPYILIIAGADEFMVERALQRVAQQGVSLQANSAMSAIRSVIVYDGWSGTRGNKTVSYSGVTAGKGYLVSQQYRGQDYISFEKQALQNGGMQEDISRFLTQSVWDSYYGVYANPLRTVEEITFPS